ncbi:hypothetical protein [Bauldia sp.]|uniref:hypothetical protein n=1 Tax=Bauldia sp. TaxID=2575872 RepID=UPI003BAC4912
MPFLIMIAGALAAAAFWYFRMRGPADTASDVINAAGHAKGAIARRRFRRKVEGATLAGVDDPGLAAAIYLVSLADAGSGITDDAEIWIAGWLRDTVAYDDPVEAVTFGKWAAREVVDVNEVGRRLMPIWRDQLDGGQRQELIAAATKVATLDGEPEPAQLAALRRLKDGLTN